MLRLFLKLEGILRVLFSSTWGYGHIFPMIPLARAFVTAGHEVLWATSADSCELVRGTGMAVSAAGLSGTELRSTVRSLNEEATARADPPDRAAWIFPRMFGEAFVRPMAADLLPIAHTWRPDLLVHEHGELASPLVGMALGLPSLTHAFGGAIPASFLASAGDRVKRIWAEYGLEPPPFAGCFGDLYLDICPPSVQSVTMAHVGARQTLRPVADVGSRPLERPDYLVPDERPLVYLTLGTVFNAGGVMRTAMEALAELPIRLLVSLGPGSDAAMLNHGLSNVRVERWVNQPQVLEQCAVVVSHAGSGTFLGALAHGLPQLCLPQAADQFRNVEGGLRSGAVLALTPREATPVAIASSVGRLLEEDSFRRGAALVAAEIEAMPSPAEVVQVLNHRYGRPPA